jgi:hypothetical protein
MVEQDVEQFLNYFDESRVQIRFVSMPDESPDVVWYAEFLAAGTEFADRDDIIRQLEQAIVDDPRIPAHTLDVKRSYLDWGASAAIQEILVQVAEFFLEQSREAAADMIKVGIGAGLAELWSVGGTDKARMTNCSWIAQQLRRKDGRS